MLGTTDAFEADTKPEESVHRRVGHCRAGCYHVAPAVSEPRRTLRVYLRLRCLVLAAVTAGVLLLPSVSLAAADYSSTILADHPAAYWRLNDATASSAHNSVSGSPDGTHWGSITPGQPAVSGGGSYVFDGSSSEVEASGNPFQFQSTFTVEAWINSTSVPPNPFNSAFIFGNYAYGYRLVMDPNGVVEFDHSSTSSTSVGVSNPGSLLDGKWHYVAGTKDGTALNLYVDGRLVASTPDTASVYYDPQTAAVIGGPYDLNAGGPNPTGPYFKGSIAEVALYNYALSPSQVTAHLSGPIPAPLPLPPSSQCSIFAIGPDACWRVGLAAGSTAIDTFFTGVQQALNRALKPGRPPDWVVLSVGASPVDLLTASGTVTLTCAGDVFGGRGGSVGPSVPPVSAILGSGFVGLPGAPLGSRSWGEVDGFVSGNTVSVTEGALAGVTGVFSPLAPGPKFGVEYWAGPAAQLAATFSYSLYLYGPDPYLALPGSNPLPLFPGLAGLTCGDITKTPEWLVIMRVPSLVAINLGSGGITSVLAGSVVRIAGAAFARLSTIKLTLHSKSVLLGYVRTDARGAFHTKVWVPGDTPVGNHTIVAQGVGRAGPRTVVSRVRVTRPQLAIVRVRESNRIWREPTSRMHSPPVGTTLSVTLNRKAAIIFAFTQRVRGRNINGRCVARSTTNRQGGSCNVIVTRGTLRLAGHAGIDSLFFNGRISRSNALAPGKYTLVIIATNRGGERSKPRRVTFTIVK